MITQNEVENVIEKIGHPAINYSLVKLGIIINDKWYYSKFKTSGNDYRFCFCNDVGYWIYKRSNKRYLVVKLVNIVYALIVGLFAYSIGY